MTSKVTDNQYGRLS